MKFIVPKEDFVNSLNITTHVLSSKTNLPVLNNILISVTQGKLEVVSTNLEMAVRASTICKSEVDGGTTVPGKLFVEFISQLPEGDISVEKLGEELVVRTKRHSGRFSTIEAGEFPAIPKIEKGISLGLKKGSLLEMAKKTAFSAAQDEGRPVLTGVLCEISKKTFSMVATDGYRLSFSRTNLDSLSPSLKLIIPARAIGEAGRIISENEGQEENLAVTVAENMTQVVFRIGSVELTSRLIEGEFPNWQKIIPEKFLSKVKIAKEELLRTVKLASIFARDAGNIVKLNLSGGNLTISASTNQVGSNEVEVPVVMEGKGGEIAFNFRYLLEVLGVISEENVIFEMSESLTPGKISIPGKSNEFFHIIMPVRLQG